MAYTTPDNNALMTKVTKAKAEPTLPAQQVPEIPKKTPPAKNNGISEGCKRWF